MSPTNELQPGGKAPFKKGHVRNKSTSSAMGGSTMDLTVMQPIVKKSKEVIKIVIYSYSNAEQSSVPLSIACLPLSLSSILNKLLIKISAMNYPVWYVFLFIRMILGGFMY